MKTQIYHIGDLKKDENTIIAASKVIRKGGLVVFPTETVYGLGTDAFNPTSINKIFEAKGRPSDNPLIIHICCLEQLKEIASNVPDKAKLLAKHFWPGPLTIILNKKDTIPDIVTAGLKTVAIRFPSHPIALSLIEHAGVPIAAPSANISGKPSGTSFESVIDDLNGKVDVILDGGDSDVGLESTVLDLTDDVPTILRPGGISLIEIEKIIGKTIYDPSIANTELAPKSPGMKYRHYSPQAMLYVVKGNETNTIMKINEICNSYNSLNKKVGILCTQESSSFYQNSLIKIVGSKNNPESIASNLFESLRFFDKTSVDLILSESFSKKGIGEAIMNRLYKASGGNIIEANPPNNILFVCTGNTCRSPMAEYIFNSNIINSYTATSAGIFTLENSPANPSAILTMKKLYDIDMKKHLTSQISNITIDQANIILTMTFAHKQSLMEMFPQCSKKVYTINEYVLNNYSDVLDPYGGLSSTYDQCAKEIYALVKQLINKLENS